uniref:Copine C-terminal domain-containing protein n=1 Tax=Sorghum bicolor TaxID=4558 RepID=C6JRM2_SORBI
MSGFLAVVGKIGTFLLWVLFLVLQTATRIVGSLLASPAEQQEDHQQESAVGRRRSPPASPRRELYEPASAPPAQLWDPPPLPYLAFAPAADENPSSSFRRRASAPLPRADEDVVVSSSAYSRPTVAVAHTNSVSATPLRTIETRAMPSRLATAGGKRPRLERKYSKILDQYRSLDEVIEALAQAGLESSNLIIGIDFTKSNEWTGKKSFNGMSLHNISDNPNPYEQAITIIGKTLSAFDEDNLIPCFGFGDGPTSFAPIIEMATTIVEQSGGQYHVLVIIADGQVTRSVDTEFGQLSTQEQMTVDAIVQASATASSDDGSSHLQQLQAGDLDMPWHLEDVLLLHGSHVFVPVHGDLRHQVLLLAHTAGHEGIQKTLHRLRGDFYIRGDTTLVRDFMLSCSTCQRNKTETLQQAGLL